MRQETVEEEQTHLDSVHWFEVIRLVLVLLNLGCDVSDFTPLIEVYQVCVGQAVRISLLQLQDVRHVDACRQF